MSTKREVWQKWANRYIDTNDPIPLFETDEEERVAYKHYGKNGRRILKRSKAMDSLIKSEGRTVIDDWEAGSEEYDGLIYLMYWIRDGEVVPLYVGKAGKYGRGEDNLSANLKGLRGSATTKFARWGDGHYYHIGNLSAILFDHDQNQKAKYQKWADRLFQEGRQLREPTYFWAKAWHDEDVGLYHDFEIPLEQLEYQIIGLVSDLYSNVLLNDEGAN